MKKNKEKVDVDKILFKLAVNVFIIIIQHLGEKLEKYVKSGMEKRAIFIYDMAIRDIGSLLNKVREGELDFYEKIKNM